MPQAAAQPKPVVICACAGVTDVDIEAARRAGARTREDLARVCDAGDGCGGCVELLEQLLSLGDG